MATNHANLVREFGGDLARALTIAGVGFEFIWRQTVAAGDSAYVRASFGSKYVLLESRDFATAGSRGYYRGYVGAPEGTPGDPIVIQKLRPDSPIGTSLSAIFETGVDTTGLTPVAEIPIYGGPGNNDPGAGQSDKLLRITPPGTIFTLELNNSSGASAEMFLHLNWFEVSPEFLMSTLEV